MKIYLFFAVLFTLQTIQSSEKTLNDVSNMLTAMIAFGHRHIDRPTFHDMKSLSKPFATFIRSKEDNFYSITISKDGKQTASARLICSECFVENCTHNAKKYRGLLYRTAANGQCYKTYLLASEINPLVHAYSSIKSFYHILNPSLIAEIPYIPITSALSVYNNGENIDFSYNRISRPYVIPGTDNIGILEGISSLPHTEKYTQIIPSGCTIHECVFSAEGIITRKPVEFETHGIKHWFGLLYLFPQLYEKYIINFENQSGIIVRDEKSVTFIDDDLHAEFLTDEVTLKSFQCGYQQLIECAHNNTWNHEKKDHYNNPIEYSSPIALVHAAFWAKVCGNKHLAIKLLKEYDACEQKTVIKGVTSFDEGKITLQPLGGLQGWGYEQQAFWRSMVSDYHAIVEQLTSVSAIDIVLSSCKRREIKQLHKYFFVEMIKDTDQYTLYPWVFGGTYDGFHWSHEWWRGKKFILKNCKGTIKTVIIDQDKMLAWEKSTLKEPLKQAQSFDSITVIQEQEDDGIKEEITHTLHPADYITPAPALIDATSTDTNPTDATDIDTNKTQNNVMDITANNSTTELIPTLTAATSSQSTPESLPLPNPTIVPITTTTIIQSTPQPPFLANFLFGILNPQKIVAGIWAIFTQFKWWPWQ